MTALHPEQRRALDYLARKGTAASADALRAELQSAFAAVEAGFAGVEAGGREWAPAAGRWSAVDILDHLVLSHGPAVDQLAALLQGVSPAGGAIPAGLQSPAGDRAEWEELIDRLRAVHASLLGLMNDASDGHSLAPRAPVEIVVKIADAGGATVPVHWQERLDWKAFVQGLRVHTLEHLRQLERVKSARLEEGTAGTPGDPERGS